MSEEMLIRHCAPTLAGLKTGSLFSCQYHSEEQIRGDIRRFNHIFVPKGLRILPLYYGDGRALIYLYRPACLWRDLSERRACALLKSKGYSCESVNRCVAQLVKRLRMQSEFPHEIGLFLSYPPEDVDGFIRNKADGCKCVGNWKVYGDEAKSRKQFACYQKCTDVYYAQWLQGRSVERLTVAVGNKNTSL